MIITNEELLSVKEASAWATDYLKKKVTSSNISYLIQYGRIRKINSNGSTKVSKNELIKYYESYNGNREISWKNQLGDDLNWALSFDQYKESETTKHVHRLHPYKGKFIPQLVEYFIDNHTDKFKTKTYFNKGDILLDPFSGSGTTMVQSCELGLHCIGIDISAFNALIGNCKVLQYDIDNVQKEIDRITIDLKEFLTYSHTLEFEKQLLKSLYEFNNKYFPVPEYKYRLKQGEIDEEKYGYEKETEFLPIYRNLVKKYKINLQQSKSDSFLDTWYSQHIRDEIQFVFEAIKKIKGIFSSPPYVGLIDYHEQHAYAYDLFGFERKDVQEIGPLFKGQGKEAKLKLHSRNIRCPQ